jgi:hypothetical protein
MDGLWTCRINDQFDYANRQNSHGRVRTGGIFWFKAAAAGEDASNVTFKAGIGTTRHHLMYGQKKDVKRSMRLMLKLQSALDLQSTQVHGPFMFWKERVS